VEPSVVEFRSESPIYRSFAVEPSVVEYLSKSPIYRSFVVGPPVVESWFGMPWFYRA